MISASSRAIFGLILIATTAVFLAVPPPEALGQEFRTTFALHDGIPSQYIPTDGDHNAIGTFFYPTDYGRLYQVTKVRFYHGYNYPPPQVGYEYRLYLVYRDLSDSDYLTVHVYPRADLPPLATTCNYCWEELEIPWWGLPVLLGGDTFNECLGLFMRPESTDNALDYPFLWVDAATDFPQTSSTVDFSFIDTDNITGATYSTIGDLLIDIEITYMDETATDESSFSVLKQIWSPPLRDD